MTFYSRLIGLTSSAAVLLFTGCTKNTVAPTATGNISGYVVANDENGNPLAKNGTTVTVDDATPQLSTTTDATGKYEFDDLAAGTYNLTFTRTGFGTIRRLGVGHLGGPDATFLGNTTIAQPSNTTVTSLSVGTPTAAGAIVLQVMASNPTAGVQLRVALFAGSATGVTATSGTLLGVYTINAAGSSNVTLTPTELHSAGFASGSQVYVVGYGAPVTNPSFVDPTTGRTVYPNLNATASTGVNFVAP